MLVQISTSMHMTMLPPPCPHQPPNQTIYILTEHIKLSNHAAICPQTTTKRIFIITAIYSYFFLDRYKTYIGYKRRYAVIVFCLCLYLSEYIYLWRIQVSHKAAGPTSVALCFNKHHLQNQPHHSFWQHYTHTSPLPFSSTP